MFFVGVLILLIIIFPDISSIGVSDGLLISANVIIPSLFPFMVCVLMLIKSGFIITNRFFNRIIFSVFGHNFDMFFVFILSMLGGYPVGAKLVHELYIKKAINKQNANLMLLYCVNAGPAFIISAVGGGVFLSYKIGIILLISHILASVIIALTISKKIKKHNCENINAVSIKSFSENFVTSVADASASILQICSFVIIFSSINAYLEYFLGDLTTIKNIIYFTEVTSAVTKTNNLIFVSFLLGFSGFSIWFQIFSISKKYKINYLLFIIGRVMHGTISSCITYILLKIFKVSLSTFSNKINFVKQNVYSNLSVSVSLLIMLVVLLVFIYSKNCSRKIINDMV